MEIVETQELSAGNLVSAMQRTFYGGEKFVLRIGELEVGLVPLEDVQSSDLVEGSKKEKEWSS